MERHRAITDFKRLTSGPGNVGKALQLTREDNHIDVTKEGALYVVQGIIVPDADIDITPRIGISKAQDKLWRFVINKDKRQNILKKLADS
jgi:DNA-3-methyladenine glycosylase